MKRPRSLAATADSNTNPCVATHGAHHFVTSNAAVREVIALASELTDDERTVVIDAIAPKESVANLVSEWATEIAQRAELVRAGRSSGKPEEEVFDRLEPKVKAR